LKTETLFIADLHLTLERPEITQRFLAFLENRASRVESLYILGDFFDAWIGDDDPTPPNRTVIKQLNKLTSGGTKVFLQQGNRDFLLGDRFFQETGVTPLEDYKVIDLYGVPTLLMHGDLLCTDDIAYQEFRNKSHTPEWRHKMLSKPLIIRMLIARWFRLRSRFHKNRKTAEIMDVNQQTVLETLRAYKAERLIHGHTHRPAVHDFQLDGRPVQRFVLENWKPDSASFLCWNKEGYTIESV
jgi:UDP-2,3-diacylglucosamine hydrolase